MSVPTSRPEQIHVHFFVPFGQANSNGTNLTQNSSPNENRGYVPLGVILFGSNPQEFMQSDISPNMFMAPEGVSMEDIITRIVEARSAQDAFKSRPASEKSVNSLKEYKIKEDSELLSSDCHGCSVCLDSFEKDEIVNYMPCHHVFHKDCLNPWLKQSNTCPSCRCPLLTEDSEFNEKVLQDMSKRSGCIMQSIHLCEHQDEIQHTDNLINLSCGHSFHSSCFNTSLFSTNQHNNENIRCPYCRHSSQVINQTI